MRFCEAHVSLEIGSKDFGVRDPRPDGMRHTLVHQYLTHGCSSVETCFYHTIQSHLGKRLRQRRLTFFTVPAQIALDEIQHVSGAVSAKIRQR